MSWPTSYGDVTDTDAEVVMSRGLLGQTQPLAGLCATVLLLGGLIGLLPRCVLAFDNEESRATLRGLVGIEVGVGEVMPAIQRSGVTLKTIRTEVARQLRRAGFIVLNREELLQRSDAAFLAVTVGATRPPASRLYAYSIDVSLYQTATLMRDPAIVLSLPTWSITSFGIVRSTDLRALLGSIRKRVDQFIKAHKSVNPRTVASQSVPARTTSAARSKVQSTRTPARAAQQGKASSSKSATR